MKKFINKAMLTLVVFGLAIVSSFAMETDPPTEPVKTTVETEVVEEVQPALFGYGYYDSVVGKCMFLGVTPPSPDCSVNNSGEICLENVDNIDYELHLVNRATTSSPWVCGASLKKP